MIRAHPVVLKRVQLFQFLRIAPAVLRGPCSATVRNQTQASCISNMQSVPGAISLDSSELFCK